MSKKFKEYIPETVYTCSFCGDTFLFEDHAKQHREECIRNPIRCDYLTTDKDTKILMVDPKQEGYNGYTDARLLKWLGAYNRLVIDTDEGQRELKEEEILTHQGDFHQPIEPGQVLEIVHSELWKEELDLIAQAVLEQRKIGETMEEFWNDIADEIKDLENKGLNEQEIAKYLKEQYDLDE